jgi:hypothetical protein
MRKLRIENLRVATCKLAGLGAWELGCVYNDGVRFWVACNIGCGKILSKSYVIRRQINAWADQRWIQLRERRIN